ncbi:FIG00947452: hypothetical protein [Alloactinosynnema sp. L-07]|nr:FIG00947452: hypothetical protein [Alloactinosynnema sp. L-07]
MLTSAHARAARLGIDHFDHHTHGRNPMHCVQSGQSLERVNCPDKMVGTAPRAREGPGQLRVRPRDRGNSPGSAGRTRRRAGGGVRGGTAPRARGGRPQRLRGRDAAGNSPASAGRTGRCRSASATGWEQPRERGEDVARTVRGATPDGTAPRARGGRSHVHRGSARLGNSPASAGRTPSANRNNPFKREQPRERGEDVVLSVLRGGVVGTAPRARGGRQRRPAAAAPPGNSPASAGRTVRLTIGVDVGVEQPRERGEDREITRVPGRDFGNSPASAGRTVAGGTWAHRRWKQPRERGEDGDGRGRLVELMETAPRARGGRAAVAGPAVHRRNSPASAGRTRGVDLATDPGGKQPRERGEDHSEDVFPTMAGGNSPASAGRTRRRRPRRDLQVKQPRERGEDSRRPTGTLPVPETAPRARGGQHHPLGEHRQDGNSPASAGRTCTRRRGPSTWRKQPRERGEDEVVLLVLLAVVETAPRARGGPRPPRRRLSVRGNSPASAGRTATRCARCGFGRKQPRERGEDEVVLLVLLAVVETAPRARGGPRPPRRRLSVRGNSPASAGRTLADQQVYGTTAQF